MSSTPAETGRGFVDTSILVYAHDVTAGPERAKARGLLLDLWDTGKGCLDPFQ